MKQAKVVIGANLGDEGKGLITDFLARTSSDNSVIIRFNGGAQAAHTVELPTGERHVFHHFGSGSFSGAKTFLSRFFVNNPILFYKESLELKKYNLHPKVFVDPESCVTTPYDMMINQIIESIRGGGRHGSCGVGFGETVERSSHSEFILKAQDMKCKKTLIKTLRLIQLKWLPNRLSQLGIQTITEEWKERIASEEILKRYCEDVGFFMDHVEFKTLSDFTSRESFIFEGAQGLLLDQDYNWFPHVTRSSTGLKNVVTMADELDLERLDVTYITRCYLTRHGAGPLPHEVKGLPYSKISDPTNIPNQYQGALRFSWLNVDLLKSSIQNDLNQDVKNLKITPSLAITCLDQVDDSIKYIVGQKIRSGREVGFVEDISQELGIKKGFLSHGPTYKTISPW